MSEPELQRAPRAESEPARVNESTITMERAIITESTMNHERT